jgi:hypothetical protein
MTAVKTFYEASPIKPIRRTRKQMDGMLDVILEILNSEENRITIRHPFYRLVGKGVNAGRKVRRAAVQ